MKLKWALLGMITAIPLSAFAASTAPTIDPNIVGTVHIVDNPAVTSIAFLANWVLGAIGGIAIFAGLINVVTKLTKHLSGSKEALGGVQSGVFGSNLFKGNSLVVVLLEFFFGVMLLGFAISGSWIQIVNSLMVVGTKFFDGLGSAITPK